MSSFNKWIRIIAGLTLGIQTDITVTYTFTIATTCTRCILAVNSWTFYELLWKPNLHAPTRLKQLLSTCFNLLRCKYGHMQVVIRTPVFLQMLVQ